MAPDNAEAQLQVRFVTKQEQYAVSDIPYAIQSNVQSSDLNTLLNALLKETNSSLENTIDFDFLVCGELLCSSLAEHLQEKEASTEETIEVEYLERFPAPSPQDCLMHDDWVSAVQAHGNWILSGSYDNSIHIWSTKGQHKLAIPGHTSPVKAVSWVSFVNNQGIFVSGSHDQSAMLWVWNVNNNSVDCVVTCRGHEKGIECIAVSADGHKFATGGWDNNICLWSASISEDDNAPAKKKSKPEHVNTRDALTTLKGHREAVSGVKWMDFNTVLSSGWDHLLKIWDCELGGIKQEIAGNKAFFDVDWSPLNNSIITASADRHLRLFDPRSTESIVKTTFTSHNGWVQSVRWSNTRDTLFLSAGYDGQVKLWETRSPRTPLYDLSGHEDKVLCCDWSNPSLLISGSCDNTLRIFKAKTAVGSA
ncbi:ribosome biogenesis protein WDR12 homolog [Plodia interpunctella]|uniref:ribosome biogenesis protein WDR12 homolog n=1 Tax=Plodia interpunctella TaxID=58824 RepID=UPI0023688BBD|nr:ribosome biogenesis protein WDR12 homolog [Plodia interpunctella]